MKNSGRAWAYVESLIAAGKLSDSQRAWAESFYDRDPAGLARYVDMEQGVGHELVRH